eukprot:340128-Ditylum_brightwellii.AAC.1
MIDTIQPTLIEKDKTNDIGMPQIAMTIQEAIAKQFKKMIPENVKVTVNHLLKNNTLDKTTSTTIDTTVSTITGNKGSKEVIETIPEQSSDDDNIN